MKNVKWDMPVDTVYDTLMSDPEFSSGYKQIICRYADNSDHDRMWTISAQYNAPKTLDVLYITNNFVNHITCTSQTSVQIAVNAFLQIAAEKTAS